MYGGKFAFKNRLSEPYSWQEIYRFSLFYFVFEGNFQVQEPWEAYIWRGDLTEDFLRYEFGGLMFGILRYLGIEIVSCHLQLQMTIIDMDLLFLHFLFKFYRYACKNYNGQSSLMKFILCVLHHSTGTYYVWVKVLTNDCSKELTCNSNILETQPLNPETKFKDSSGPFQSVRCFI